MIKKEYRSRTNQKNSMIDALIDLDGGTWRILSVGVTREDGKTMCHLASTTNGRQQRNGFCPTQICDWVNLDQLAQADPITSYYSDRANGFHAAKAP